MTNKRFPPTFNTKIFDCTFTNWGNVIVEYSKYRVMQYSIAQYSTLNLKNSIKYWDIKSTNHFNFCICNLMIWSRGSIIISHFWFSLLHLFLYIWLNLRFPMWKMDSSPCEIFYVVRSELWCLLVVTFRAVPQSWLIGFTFWIVCAMSQVCLNEQKPYAFFF